MLIDIIHVIYLDACNIVFKAWFTFCPVFIVHFWKLSHKQALIRLYLLFFKTNFWYTVITSRVDLEGRLMQLYHCDGVQINNWYVFLRVIKLSLLSLWLDPPLYLALSKYDKHVFIGLWRCELLITFILLTSAPLDPRIVCWNSKID